MERKIGMTDLANRKPENWRYILLAVCIFVLLAHNFVWNWSSFRIGGFWGGLETYISTRHRLITERPERLYLLFGMPWMFGMALGSVALAIRPLPFWIGATLVVGAIAVEIFFWTVLIWTGWSS